MPDESQFTEQTLRKAEDTQDVTIGMSQAAMRAFVEGPIDRATPITRMDLEQSAMADDNREDAQRDGFRYDYDDNR
ncbi:hypothetical protein [Effusibacillus pohliae]|uniref:hypothetical protein n=1 Tax=Effusibacillus pohliae TaxID=232270 RepID=UPI0003640730|nr:hypothetical protein [Effusibacillus pohliae]